MTSTTPDWETEVANAMGPNPGGFFCRLSDEVAFLHYTWQQCCSLFVADRPGRDVLMGAAPAAFGLLEYVMRDYILLQICRLTDPATSGKYTNLTFRGLQAQVADPTLRNTLDGLIANLEAKVAGPRDHRNKRIAHLDAVTALGATGTPPTPLQPIGATQIDQAIAAMRDVVSAVESHYGLIHNAYEHMPPPLGGADRLKRLLQSALDVEKQRREDRRKGAGLIEDSKTMERLDDGE